MYRGGSVTEKNRSGPVTPKEKDVSGEDAVTE